MSEADSSTDLPPPPTPRGPSCGNGVCPVKAAYLRTQALPRTSMDAEGRTRGMNKGSERLHVEGVAGTERPSFEGESNFLSGEVLTRVKEALRYRSSHHHKVGEDHTIPAENRNEDNKRPREEEPTAPAEAGMPLPTAETAVAPAAPTEALEAAMAAQRDARKVVWGAAHIPFKLTSDEIRQQQDKSRGLFTNRTILAPLTTVGNLPFRRICKEFGADNTVSEMAMVYNLNKTQKSEWSLLRRHEGEDVFGIQVAVSRVDDAVMFARSLHASGFSYDYVDINCGCPVDLIVKSGCGCGLWEKKGRLREVVKALTSFQAKPVTIKCRIGDDETAPTLHRQIAEYEGWGASAVTIHGRSRRQRYTKLANWDYIEQCAKLTALPVIGNGDILSYDDIEEHRRMSPSVVSHLVARGALIKPWIFDEIKQQRSIDISSHERFEMLKKFTRYGLAHWGSDEKGVLTTRRFLCEWLSFLYRYVPMGLLERLPQRINERPPMYEGRDALETLMSSDSAVDWIRITEMLLGPAGEKFVFTPKHKSNSYASGAAPGAAPATAADDGEG
jgi:tRNA-dihydrouridine synthase 3